MCRHRARRGTRTATCPRTPAWSRRLASPCCRENCPRYETRASTDICLRYHVIYKTRAFCQDRLGTNTGKALKKERSACVLQAPRDPDFEWGCEKRHLFLRFPYVCPEPVLAKYSFLYINGSKMPFFAGRRTHLIGSKWPTGYDARSSLVFLSAFPLMFGPRDCLGKSMGFSIRKAESVVLFQGVLLVFFNSMAQNICGGVCLVVILRRIFARRRASWGRCRPRRAGSSKCGASRYPRKRACLGKDFRCIVICKTKTRNFAKTGFGQAPDDFTKKGVCSMLSFLSWPIAR